MDIEKIIAILSADSLDSSIYDIFNFDPNTSKHKIKLTYSPSDEQWTDHIKGKTAVSLKDTGNGVKIKYHDCKKKATFDYSDIAELYILLDYYFNHSNAEEIKQKISFFKEIND